MESESVVDWKLEGEVNEESYTVEGEPPLKLVFWTRPGQKIDGARNVALYHYGLGEYVRRIAHIGAVLLKRCPELDAFVSFDIRGHGESGGARGAIASSEELEQDYVERIIPALEKRCHDEMRLLMMGHSLGGLVTACAANRPDVLQAIGNGGRIVGVFLSAPAIDCIVHGAVNKILAPTVHLVKAAGGGRVTKTNDIPGKLVSSDPKVIEAYDKGDTRLMNKVSFGLASSLFSRGAKLVKEVTEKGGDASVLRSDVPCLVIQGEEDQLAAPSGSKKLSDAIANKVEYEVISGARHEVFNELPEKGRTAFFDKLTTFTSSVFAK